MENKIQARELRLYNLVLCRGKLAVITEIGQIHIGYLSPSMKGEKKIRIMFMQMDLHFFTRMDTGVFHTLNHKQ